MFQLQDKVVSKVLKTENGETVTGTIVNIRDENGFLYTCQYDIPPFPFGHPNFSYFFYARDFEIRPRG